MVVPDEPAEDVAPLSGFNGGGSDTTEGEGPAVESPALETNDLPPTAAPNFREALSEFFGAPASEARTEEASEPPHELEADGPGRPRGTEASEVSEVSEAVVRIPFDRVVGQLPPGAFRVPLGQVGARLREADALLVPQAVIVPQLGEGVVQVGWELVAEQFPAGVFAVAPGEMKERIVNGRLLLPLDEIVRQLPPDVFAASMGRAPVEVPGIESFPAPFKPLEWEEPPFEPADGKLGSPTAPGDAEKLAALVAPWETSALEEVQVGNFAIISVSATGLAGSAVAAAAGRLSSVIARRAPRPVDQATLRGVGGTLVLTPVGSGWSTATALAVGVLPGRALAHLEILARRAAAAHVPASPSADQRDVTPAARLDAAPPPAAAAVAAADLEAFGPLTAHSYREPTSGVLIHCFVSPGASAAELAPFAWELEQVMAQGAEAGALGSFHSAVLRSGRERLEIRRLGSTTGPAPVLVVAGADTGRPGLARLQVERAAARLSGA
jgi:hypothetical protein